MKPDIYQRITDQIVGELEKGVRPWLKPWNAEHATGRVTRSLRGNGIPLRKATRRSCGRCPIPIRHSKRYGSSQRSAVFSATSCATTSR
jgi:hypothetical protein